MKRILLIMALAVIGLNAVAATVENEYFKITTLDDSWFLTNDDALRPIGARVDIARMDAQGATLELARVDYMEGAFDPLMYINMQVVGKKDVFCRSASGFTEVYQTRMAGFDAQCVQFKKTSHNYSYDCEAYAFNVGYGTVLVLMAHRAGNPSLVGRLVDAMTFKVDTKQLTTSGEYVDAASKVVKRHHLPIGNNEHLSGVEMSPDSTTVTLKVTVPYITKENVNVPAFVMTKRDAWLKQAHEALRFNLLLASITRERKSLRYHYVDTKGNEIGTLLIVPEEYEQIENEMLAQSQPPQPQQEAVPQPQQEAVPQPQQEVAPQQQEVVVEQPAPAAQAAPQQEPENKPAATDVPITYVVKPGDNLTKIA
ncbi:MAG: hypothetical protein IJ925_00285, partial [Muribaculaceae bacterium]|nr:hypothetical protein [Muribaculaceae bacterium]